MKNIVNEGCFLPFLFQKVYKIMKITALFIVLGILDVMAYDAYSQKAKITLKANDVSLEEVLDEIENQSEFYFIFNQKLIDTDRRVHITAKNQNIKKVLNKLFTGTNVIYKVYDRQIVLSNVQANNKNNDVNGKLYRDGKLDMTFAGQKERLTQNTQRVISGRVTDAANDAPLVGVNVVEKGTNNGTITDINGVYQLTVSDSSATLVFSYIGYETLEVEIGNRTVLDLKLSPDITKLQEVIVVGYGSVKKSDLTGSVASVKAEELTAYPAVDAVQALQGRAAGVAITATNGEPGSGYNIQIRGNTSVNASSDPLIVVDGLVGGVMPPPEDIESIEILKDASATAIYGARAANGVVMVTTRRGKSGKPQVNFSSSWSSQKEIRRLELLNADQFTTYIQEIDPSYVPELTGVGTEWQDEILRGGGLQNYQISVSGASDKVSYYLSGVAYDQKGIILDSDFQRYSITANLDIEANDIFSFGANLFTRRAKQNGTRSQEGGYYKPGVIATAYKFMPTQGIYDQYGRFTESDRGDPIDNPYALATELQIESITDLFQGNLYVDINLLKGLKFRTSVGSNIRSSRAGEYYPRTLERGGAADGEASLGFSKGTDFLTENYFTYSNNFGSHNLSVIAGYSYQSFLSERMNTYATGFISDSFSWWNIGAATDPVVTQSRRTFSEISSFYGRVNYNIGGKYLFTFNARRDGSSNFAENNKWAFFPSGAVAWVVSQEDFLSGSNTISFFKFRGSYGQTGNQAIRPYQSLATFTSVLTTVQGNQVPAIRPATLGNPDLTWETTTQLDIGLDIGFLNDRFGFTADYYHMITDDLLFTVPLPAYGGVKNQIRNIGSVENKGFEFSTNAGILDGKLKWNVNANISFNRNNILELAENDLEGNDIYYSSWPLPGDVQTQVLREGHPVGSFWGYVYNGVLQNESDQLINGESGLGAETFKDLNGDGELTDDDRTILGNPHPDFIWGWNNDFSFKGFTLNVFFQGSQGGQILNYSLMELGVLNGRTNATIEALNRWTPNNTDTDIPRANGARSYVMSDRWIEDGSYIRLKNISLAYNFPQTLLTKIKMSSARIFVSAQNILTITGYKGIDPEVAYSSSSLNLGLDYGSYPNVKSYTLGINIGF